MTTAISIENLEPHVRCAMRRAADANADIAALQPSPNATDHVHTMLMQTRARFHKRTDRYEAELPQEVLNSQTFDTMIIDKIEKNDRRLQLYLKRKH